MGSVRFTYSLRDERIKPEDIIGEIEYGASFTLFKDHERIIYPKYSQKVWINCFKAKDNTIIIEVKDIFFDDITFFYQIFSTFIFNLMDFSSLCLEDIDLSNSHLLNITSKPFAQFGHSPVLGTILKPYYQLLSEKIKLVSKLASSGLQVFKEDETFLVNKDISLEHAISIQHLLQEKGWYIPNITPYISDFQFIRELIRLSGIRIAMVNFLVTGLGAVYKLKQEFPDLNIWGHRIGYLSMEKLVSIQAISKMAVAAGIDFLHIGTPANKQTYSEKKQLISGLNKIKPTKVVFTKTDQTTIFDLVNAFSDDAVFLACGSLKQEDGISINMEKVREWTMRACQ